MPGTVSGRWSGTSASTGTPCGSTLPTRRRRAGGPPRRRQDWVALARAGFPDGPLARPHPAQAVLAPYRDRIVAGLATNTATTVWQRLVADTPVTVSLRTFRRYGAALPGADPGPRSTMA